jgi:hypothetical protein
VIGEMERRYHGQALLPSGLAWAHAAVGQVAQAMIWVRRAGAEHDVLMVCLPSFWWRDPLRRHPQFEAILRELKFPYWSLACAEKRRQRR